MWSEASIEGPLTNAISSFTTTSSPCSCEIPCIDICTFKLPKIGTPPQMGLYCSNNGVLISVLQLNRTVYCGPVVSSLWRFHCTGQLTAAQWCPHYGGSTVQDYLLQPQWCPHCGDSTVQDYLLRPSGVLIMEVPLYRTVYCGPSGVLIMEVPLYRTTYCGPVVSSLWRFHCTGLYTVVTVVSSLWRFHCTGLLTAAPVVSSLWRFHCTGLLTAAQWCPHYGGSTVQDCILRPSVVLIMEVPLYRTVYCGSIMVFTTPIAHTYVLYYT